MTRRGQEREGGGSGAPRARQVSSPPVRRPPAHRLAWRDHQSVAEPAPSVRPLDFTHPRAAGRGWQASSWSGWPHPPRYRPPAVSSACRDRVDEEAVTGHPGSPARCQWPRSCAAWARRPATAEISPSPRDPRPAPRPPEGALCPRRVSARRGREGGPAGPLLRGRRAPRPGRPPRPSGRRRRGSPARGGLRPVRPGAGLAVDPSGDVPACTDGGQRLAQSGSSARSGRGCGAPQGFGAGPTVFPSSLRSRPQTRKCSTSAWPQDGATSPRPPLGLWVSRDGAARGGRRASPPAARSSPSPRPATPATPWSPIRPARPAGACTAVPTLGRRGPS